MGARLQISLCKRALDPVPGEFPPKPIAANLAVPLVQARKRSHEIQNPPFCVVLALAGLASATLSGCAGVISGANTTNSVPPGLAPAITTQPANQIVTAGQTATFTVAASGTAPLSYQWQKNGANIAGATSSSYTTPATTTADNGSTFQVVASNSAGSITSSAATLMVNPAAAAPTITAQPTNQTVTVGQTATFAVAASGTAPLSYQWQKNGANIAGATGASYVTPATTSADN